jgi:AcrR family transcriptional regulator
MATVKSRRSQGAQLPARDRLLASAAEILARDGYTGLTMEKVAAASGVAKTTLYRHWPTKAALCMDLYLDEAGRELHDPDTGNVANDLRYVVNTVVRLQTRTVAGPALIGLIAEAQIDPRLARPSSRNSRSAAAPSRAPS